MDHTELLNRYAELAVKVGVNIQKGQYLWIGAPLGTEDFVRKVVRKAYEAGAAAVHVQWQDEKITRLHYDLAPEEAFSYYPDWLVQAHDEIVEKRGAILQIEAEDPDLLKGISTERITTYSKVKAEKLDAFYEAIESDKISWSIVAVPSQKWADKVFPELPLDKRTEKLWETIFQTVRLYEQDPVCAWQKHMSKLEERAKVLTERNYAKLHYRGDGTDISVELPEDHLWLTGSSKNQKGHSFIANMPTEEVYTVPHRLGVNGVVSNTKPLAYEGNIIDGFTLTFKEGRVVDVKAETGQELLEKIIAMDEGACYLGEVALVPDQSPISMTGTLFFNTLFDENASNHFALGSCYPTCIKGGTEMNDLEREVHGLNDSVVHEDFMIGSSEMDIDGISQDGTIEPVFRKGNWAF
ncbi:aminopeptidase [Jeotgalibacillus proteolyticus]|uniref:Aminopeptidase n=1 Tax=Jeotgalibacillus proteolyticus TaxID=2082395 RepID=A0A2S5GAG1_9BACL|nr:aminopeptidase [Jeotgalibacillus proteolyticus]PPA69992.1 aminopeptidase [Jeotgalibacillus proteolyticus]